MKTTKRFSRTQLIFAVGNKAPQNNTGRANKHEELTAKLSSLFASD